MFLLKFNLRITKSNNYSIYNEGRNKFVECLRKKYKIGK